MPPKVASHDHISPMTLRGHSVHDAIDSATSTFSLLGQRHLYMYQAYVDGMYTSSIKSPPHVNAYLQLSMGGDGDVHPHWLGCNNTRSG